jgi:hypothetical protein
LDGGPLPLGFALERSSSFTSSTRTEIGMRYISASARRAELTRTGQIVIKQCTKA